MSNTITQQILINAGLTPHQAEIYLILANKGDALVTYILDQTPLSRATVYDTLSELLTLGLLEYYKQGRQAYYKPVHPYKLYELFDSQKRALEHLENDLKQTVEEISTSYRLREGKPGIRFFEGKDGFKEVLYDTLTATETIYTFSNTDAVATWAGEINEAYKTERKRKNIKKYILMLDTPLARDRIKNADILTQIRLLPKNTPAFATGMQIYNGKISYQTLRAEKMISVLIQDQDIYDLHRHTFALLWEQARDYTTRVLSNT